MWHASRVTHATHPTHPSHATVVQKLAELLHLNFFALFSFGNFLLLGIRARDRLFSAAVKLQNISCHLSFISKKTLSPYFDSRNF